MVPIECLACGLETRRGELEPHQKNDCPEEEVECDFADQGCKERVVRKQLRRHLEDEMAYHMSLLKRAFDLQSRKLKDEYESVLKVLTRIFSKFHTQMYLIDER